MSNRIIILALIVAMPASAGAQTPTVASVRRPVGLGAPIGKDEPAPTVMSSDLPPPPMHMGSAASTANGIPAVWPTSTAEVIEHTTLPRPLENTFIIDRPFPWFDNLNLFAGLDGSKEPADTGINANFGYRLAGNWALPIIEAAGLGIQLGAAVNQSNNAVRVMRYIDGTVQHTQFFTTAGIFRRGERGLNWAIVYDYRFDDYYDRFETAQWRGQVGVPLGPDDEVGFWGTLRDRSATAALAFMPFTVRPLNQINFFWRHIWPNETATRVWLGFTEDHGRFNAFFLGEPNVQTPVCFGADIFVPLNESLALFGEAQFITPNDSGTVCATLGIAWYPGAARLAARNRFNPYLNVANHTSMPLDLRGRFDVIAFEATRP